MMAYERRNSFVDCGRLTREKTWSRSEVEPMKDRDYDFAYFLMITQCFYFPPNYPIFMLTRTVSTLTCSDQQNHGYAKVFRPLRRDPCP